MYFKAENVHIEDDFGCNISLKYSVKEVYCSTSEVQRVKKKLII